MQDKLLLVKEFHNTFLLKISEDPIAKIDDNQSQLRFDLMQEENQEYLNATKSGNLIEVADALGDMLYILCGTILDHGLQYKIDAIFDEIHRSNMSKLGENNQPIYREDGKVIKGPQYFKPNIAKILELE